MQVLTLVNLPKETDAAIMKANMESFVPLELENDPVLADVDISNLSASVRTIRGMCTATEYRRLAEQGFRVAEVPGPGMGRSVHDQEYFVSQQCTSSLATAEYPTMNCTSASNWIKFRFPFTGCMPRPHTNVASCIVSSFLAQATVP